MRTPRLLRLLIWAAFVFYTSLAAADDEITVPDVSGFSDPKAMRAAAGPDMVGLLVATSATPPPGSTKLFARQDPLANTKLKVKPGDPTPVLKIYIYQSLAVAATPSPAASLSMPDLTGLTLDQAVARLPANTQVLGDEMGDYPPAPERALTIFSQTPAAGTTIDPQNPPVVKVKRYGSARTYDASTDPLAGTWVGVSIYKTGDKPIEMFIRKQGAEYLLLPVGDLGAYPLETDGVRMWHTFMLKDITYQLEGETLVGNWRQTDPQGVEHTGQTRFHRK